MVFKAEEAVPEVAGAHAIKDAFGGRTRVKYVEINAVSEQAHSVEQVRKFRAGTRIGAGRRTKWERGTV